MGSEARTTPIETVRRDVHVRLFSAKLCAMGQMIKSTGGHFNLKFQRKLSYARYTQLMR